jgi:Ca2+-transporting ATPase
MMGFGESSHHANGDVPRKKGLPEECRIPMMTMGKGSIMTTTTTTTTTTMVDGSPPVDGDGLLEATLRRLGVDGERGLSMAQVLERRARFGANELATSKGERRRHGLLLMRLWSEWEEEVKGYLDQFQNPLIMLLIGSALVSLLLGQMENAISIALVRADSVICAPPLTHHSCR